MGIRSTEKRSKDHLADRAALRLVSEAREEVANHPLRFWTVHPEKPTLVDLELFAAGEQEQPLLGTWNGPFSGRPVLILELAPAIRDLLTPLAEKSVDQYLVALRTWWRVFDTVEGSLPAVQRTASVTELNDVHRQVAIDSGMRRLPFTNFLRLANTTRIGLGLRPLLWAAPEDPAPNRQLPEARQSKLIRIALKHRWFDVLDRWNVADRLLDEGAPHATSTSEHEAQALLLRNYSRYRDVVRATGDPRPRMQTIWGEMDRVTFARKGYSVAEMMRGFYPDGYAVRDAFHLCLATTGWNPAVLLSLNANENFIEPHPKDRSRYIMRGSKARAGDEEQTIEGLVKSQGSPGMVIQALIDRTRPLREKLREDLRETMTVSAARNTEQSDNLRKRIAKLSQAIKSPWIYVSRSTADIQFLDDRNFGRSIQRKTQSYLGDLILELNGQLAPSQAVPPMTASDLRDAYAAHVYTASGGSILSVMKALGHRSLSSTRSYLDNSLLRDEHRRIFRTFSAALWSEISNEKRVDPTLLAKLTNDGIATPVERARLDEYRSLLRSRIGVGCKDPAHPPRRIAPNFPTDGKTLCNVQRCTLCLENAVIFPESIDGLCKRLAELYWLRERMSIAAFLQSSFAEEIENTELALLAFDQAKVKEHQTKWEQAIASGAHRVVSFDGELLT